MATKTVSIEKLQAFIEAVEFAADLERPEEWVPTARQWKKIRSMIDALEEQPVVQASPAPMTYGHGLTAGGFPVPQGPVGPIQLAGPSAFDNLPPAPMMGGAPVPLARDDRMQVKTPDVDTSNGHYDSSFA